MYKKIFDSYKVTFTDNCIHIEDSYKCKNFKDIENILNNFRSDENASKYMKRINRSYANEWATHNLLYYLGILKDRTGSVDLNYPLKWYIEFVYFILGNIYKIFY